MSNTTGKIRSNTFSKLAARALTVKYKILTGFIMTTALTDCFCHKTNPSFASCFNTEDNYEALANTKKCPLSPNVSKLEWI